MPSTMNWRNDSLPLDTEKPPGPPPTGEATKQLEPRVLANLFPRRCQLSTRARKDLCEWD